MTADSWQLPEGGNLGARAEKGSGRQKRGVISRFHHTVLCPKAAKTARTLTKSSATGAASLCVCVVNKSAST